MTRIPSCILAASALSLGTLALAHCSSSPSEGAPGPVVAKDAGSSFDPTSDAAPPDLSSDAAPANDASLGIVCTATPTQPVARPTCTATSLPGSPGGASAPDCTTVADCTDAGAFPGAYKACLSGKCAVDQCLTDADCASGQACGCVGGSGGNVNPFNQCIATQCRTSADCASGNACSPSSGGYCSTLTGFYCHSSADECATDTDCSCKEPLVGAVIAQCAFSTQLGHFACQVPKEPCAD